jgi:hypothetical protein
VFLAALLDRHLGATAAAGRLEAPALPLDAGGGGGDAAPGCEFGCIGTKRTHALLWELLAGGERTTVPPVAGTE